MVVAYCVPAVLHLFNEGVLHGHQPKGCHPSQDSSGSLFYRSLLLAMFYFLHKATFLVYRLTKL